MIDFSHYAQDTPDAIREYTFDGLVGQPSVMVKFAGVENSGYLSAVLVATTSRKERRRLRMEENAQAEIARQFEATRERDRTLYPKHVIVGWGKNPPTDKAGNEAPFNDQTVTAFVKALPATFFDKLRFFCSNEDNFLPEEAPTGEEILERGNDSRSSSASTYGSGKPGGLSSKPSSEEQT